MNKLKIYKSLDEISKTISSRKRNKFNYYKGTFNGGYSTNCILHIKFGDIRKHYINLGYLEDTFFIEEFDKYFSYKKSFFKTLAQILDYIKEHNLPIILVDNNSLKEVSINEAYELVG